MNSIVKANSNGYANNVMFEDPKKLPIFSFRSYKKKSSTSEDSSKAQNNNEKSELPLFSIKPNVSEYTVLQHDTSISEPQAVL